MNWIEVRGHLRRGAELIFTKDIPGGLCLALRHRSVTGTGRSKLIKVRELPVWAKLPSPSHAREVLAELEMAISKSSCVK